MLSNFYMNSQGREFVFDMVRRISVELLQARTTVYTIDPRGSISIADTVDVARASDRRVGPPTYDPVGGASQGIGGLVQSMAAHGSSTLPDMVLQRFAQETGGKSFWRRNDLDAQLAASRIEAAHCYTLSYDPTNRDFDGKFRTISLRVTRPGAKVRTRAGYFALPEAGSPSRDQVIAELEAALANPVRYIGIHVDGTSASGPSSQTVTLRINPHDLNFKPQADGTRECTLVTATAPVAFGDVPSFIKSHEFTAKISEKKAQSLSDEPVLIQFDVPRNSKEISRLRVVVRDETTGYMGTADILPSSNQIRP